MSNDKWNEDTIEKRLRNMPVVKDQRSKDEIMQRLKEDTRLSEPNGPKKRPSKSKWPPIIAAVAAIVLLTIIVPTFIQQNNEVSMDKATTEESADPIVMEDSEEMQSNEASDASVFTKQVSAPLSYAAYPADILDHTAFHIGLATDQAAIVPVTFLIPNERLPEGLGTSPDAVALYNEYANTIDEEALGFSEYHPYKAMISSNGNQVQMKFTADHTYDRSSATLEMLNLSVQNTFQGYDEIQFLQEDATPITFDQVGQVDEPISLSGVASRQAYYRFLKSDGEAVLSTNFGKTSETVEQALHEMKKSPNDIFSTVIPEGIDFTVKEVKGIVNVKFTKVLDLDKMQSEKALQLLDGILLTAASFDKQVEFDQIAQEQWNKFDFTRPLEKPLGANPKYLINE
ncbi:GerMN domain-containing protein [Sporosarcina ureae]|uniref:GerMN domain-containing protein n=1 Tax=Sporosarcina ureae TaxID=1571 RepID=A0ABM6JZT7_SPOUR|nr:GerMN domain-containing protein [Sporosarcina ureae]ARF15453.1 hypothetical protein SporoS204_15580 [Sporosarcina ureae]